MTGGTLISASCAALDVPVHVAHNVARRHGWEVWFNIVANSEAGLASEEAARRILRGVAAPDTKWMALMDGLWHDVLGVRRVVASDTGTPGWLVKWVLDEKLFGEEEQLLLVHDTTWAWATWYLANEAPLCERARTAAHERFKKHGDWGSFDWRRAERETLTMRMSYYNWQASMNMRQLQIDSNTGRALAPSRPERAAAASHGRRVLGDGSSIDSLAAWERFFEMAEAGVCDDIDELIDAAVRGMAEVGL